MTPLDTPVLSDTQQLGTPLLRFRLELRRAADGQPLTFHKPVRLILDARQRNVLPHYSFYLGWRDRENPTLRHELPFTLHDTAGLLSAEVMHFSDWEMG